MTTFTTIYVNSKDRSNVADSPSNFKYNLNIGTLENYNYVILSASIPLSNYVSVYPDRGQTGFQNFVLNDIGIHTVTIRNGNYTAQQLAQLMQTQMNAVAGSGPYAVTYSPTVNKFTISTAGVPFQIGFVGNNYVYPYQSLASVMGWRDASYNPINIDSTVESEAPYVCNLSGPLNYYIKSNALGVGINSFFQRIQDKVICSIPNNGAPFGVLTYLNPSITPQPIFSSNITQLDFRLVDEYDNDVILDMDWQVTIMFKRAK